LSILLVDDKKIRALNRRWRKIDRPTDVLAFAQREGEMAETDDPLLGDIVISVPRAEDQAKDHGHSLEQELDLLLTHGLLHLLGFEHVKGGGEAKKMKALEKKLVAGLNN
jgi:probable rRNA maturation factor